MNLMIIIALTISSSIDNLGVGISYGLRKVHIDVIKNLLIAVICFCMSVSGITFGRWIATILPGVVPVVVGAFLLLIIGIRIMLLSRPARKKAPRIKETNHANRKNSSLKQREMVQSTYSSIGWGESIVLGVALSANALTNGVGAGLFRFSPMLISFLAAVGSFITVWAGVRMGNRLSDVRIGSFTVGEFGTFLSGAIIVIIAFMAFF